jgi:peptidoglycan/LPS O-acetylase OafA/YrhL
MQSEIQKPSRLYEIDLLRFVAAVLVVIYHYTFIGYNLSYLSPVRYEYLEPITKYFYLGVELFFVISGYVVLMSAYNKTVKQFFISRVVRLYPVFWVTCTLTFIIVLLFGPNRQSLSWSESLQPTKMQYIVNMTMLQGFLGYNDIDAAYWTLTVEISFYFLISLLLAYGLVKNIKLFLAAWLLYTAAAQLTAAVNTPFHYLLIPKYSSFFIAGMLFYLFQNKLLSNRFFYSLLSVAYILSVRSAWVEAVEHTNVFRQPHSLVVVALSIGCIFLIFLFIINQKTSMYRFSWFSWLGGLTYPLYLLHGNIGYIILQRLGGYFNKYLLLVDIIAIMLLVSYFIHVYIEKILSKKLNQQLVKFMNYLGG